jgi:hypothetical protein
MPLEICKNARATRSKICRDVEYAQPTKGYCAAQKSYCFGYKLHGICSLSGVFQSIDITPASIHDEFRIRENFAKTFVGFKTRIISKITAITLIQHLNKFVFNRPINNLKVNLA